VKKLCILLALVLLSSCSLLKVIGEPQKIIKNITISGVAYAVGGWIPATAVAITALTVDKVLPDPEPKISEITNEVQMKAYLIANATDQIIYGALVALIIFMIVVPWATQRRAKRKMKYDLMKAELQARRNKDVS